MNTRIITLLFLTILLIACETEKIISIEDPQFDNYFYASKNIPVVKGQILNLTKDEINNTQVEYTVVTPFETDRFQITKFSQLNTDGTFELEVDYPFPYQEIWLKIGELYYAGIYAKSYLFIELDADKLRKRRGHYIGSGINYLGKDASVNEYLNNHRIYKYAEKLKIDIAVQSLNSSRNNKYNTYLTKLDSLFYLLHNIDNEFIEKNPSPYSYLIKNERMSEYYRYLCSIHSTTGKFKDVKISDELHKSILTHKAFLVSNQSSSFHNQLFYFLQSEVYDYNKPGRGYIGLINDVIDFIDYNKLSETEKDNMNQLLDFKKQIEKKQTIDNIKFAEIYNSFFDLAQDSIKRFVASETIDYLDSIFISSKADLLKLKMSSRDPNEKDMIYKTVLKSMKTKWCEQIISEEHKKNIERLSLLEDLLKKEQNKSNIHEPFEQLTSGTKLYKIDDISAEDLLSELTTKFKGKALILDFWATWCSPCIQEMHYSKKMHEKTKDLPVEFVYLCTSNGSDLALWKTKISNIKVNGTHLFVESTIIKDLMKLFSFSGFPSYAFIDTEGKYKPGAITRMSSLSKEELIKLINE